MSHSWITLSRMAKMLGAKHCKDCGEMRPVEEFTRDRTRHDGLSFYCKTHARRRLLESKDARKGPPKSRHARETLIPDGHKWCPDCMLVKPLEQFPRNASQPSGRASYCKPCHNARGKAAKEKIGGSRTYHLKRRYGITAAEADVRRLQEELDRLAGELQATLVGGGSALAWQAVSSRTRWIGDALSAAERQVLSARTAFAQANEAYRQRAVAVEALLHLRQRRWREYQDSMAAAEQQRVEEFVLRRWLEEQSGKEAV